MPSQQGSSVFSTLRRLLPSEAVGFCKREPMVKDQPPSACACVTLLLLRETGHAMQLSIYIVLRTNFTVAVPSISSLHLLFETPGPCTLSKSASSPRLQETSSKRNAFTYCGRKPDESRAPSSCNCLLKVGLLSRLMKGAFSKDIRIDHYKGTYPLYRSSDISNYTDISREKLLTLGLLSCANLPHHY